MPQNFEQKAYYICCRPSLYLLFLYFIYSLHRLAETRRKKVQELEKKIGELTRRCIEQNKIIKAKEKQDQRIKTLSSEIQTLKETRVKLIRQMRNDANNFTKWKQSKEKEINKLRTQDRKRAYEMVRMKIEYNKQENVFKRKMEEAFAINKRLKVYFLLVNIIL